MPSVSCCALKKWRDFRIYIVQFLDCGFSKISLETLKTKQLLLVVVPRSTNFIETPNVKVSWMPKNAETDKNIFDNISPLIFLP